MVQDHLSSPLDPEVRRAIEEALAGGEVTRDGRPLAGALAKRLGREVTAGERNDWWTRWNEQKAADADVQEKTATPEVEAQKEAIQQVISESKTGGPVMWVGPTLRRLVHLRQNTIFRAGVLPQALRELIEAHPELGVLVIPIGCYPKARLALASPDSEESKAARAALALAAG